VVGTWAQQSSVLLVVASGILSLPLGLP
jgi:hypothetical protein